MPGRGGDRKTLAFGREQMLNLHIRPALSRLLTPAGRALARTGLSPDVVTVIGTVGVAAGAVAFYPRGELFWGTVFITCFVFSDLIDGAMARARGTAGRWGAFLDSTLDRVGDGAIFASLVWWYAAGDEEPVLAALAMFCLVAGTVISYAKARAEGLGMTCNVGIAERSERLLTILITTGLSGLDIPYVAAVGLWALAVAAAVTVGQRMWEVYRQARTAPPPAAAKL